MYSHQQALKELDRLEEISRNKNPSEWEKEETGTLKIYSMNCRSIKKHYEDIISDDLLLKSDVICLQETWLENDSHTEDLRIPNYDLYLNSIGKGKGIAIYCKENTFKHEIDIKEEHMQITKLSYSTIDIVVLYRSQSGNIETLKQHLEALNDNEEKPLLVIGDFNFCFMDKSSNSTKEYFQEHAFKQLIKEPTHIEGNLLDQANIKDVKEIHKYSAEIHSKYYTDHKALAVMVKKS